jgi:hypothetical protein
MSLQDASRLLIAMCASTPLAQNSAVQAVERFEDLPCTSDEAENLGLASQFSAPIKLMPLASFRGHHTFGHALETLLQIAGDQRLFPNLAMNEGAAPKDSAAKLNSNFVEINFYRPVPAVVVRYQVAAAHRRVLAYGLNFGSESERYIDLVEKRKAGGKAVVTTIGENVLYKVGKAIGASSDFERIWQEITKHLTAGVELYGWSRDVGFTLTKFVIIDISATSIKILPSTSRRERPRSIAKADFETVFKLWSAYCAGMLKRSEVARRSHNATYIFGILKSLGGRAANTSRPLGKDHLGE